MFIMLYGFDMSSNDVLLSLCHPGPTLLTGLPRPSEFSTQLGRNQVSKFRASCVLNAWGVLWTVRVYVYHAVWL